MKRNKLLIKEHGITLVALIITIIILIILAAVSIKAVLDMNFANLASNAVLNYAEAQGYEEQQMNDIDSFLQSTIKKIEDEDFNTGNGDNPNPTSDPTPTEPHLPVIPVPSDKAGIYVNYVPESGIYPKEILDKYSGSTDNNAFTTDTNLKWRVWSIDDDNLYLISDKTINVGGYTQNGKSGFLVLRNHIGYNNGVTLLDQICDTCYKNSEYNGLTARNLKLEDIEAVLNYNYPTTYGTQPITYNIKAPYIYATYENKSKENALNNKSIAYELTENTIVEELENQSPYYTQWYFRGVATYKSTVYQELVREDPSTDKSYWLSSRSVVVNSGAPSGLTRSITFCIEFVSALRLQFLIFINHF